MCFDEASFSIWSQFQTEEKCSLTEKLVLSGEAAILRSSQMTLERHQEVERLMI